MNPLPMLIVCSCVMICSCAASAAGLQPKAPDQPAPDQPALETTVRVPTLDELLGLKEPGRGAAPEDTGDLEDALSPEKASEAFTKAVDLMERASDRLDAARDAGITTQRIQEDALRSLDQIIASAQQQQQSSQSSGGGAGASGSPGSAQPDQRTSASGASAAPGTQSGDAGPRPGSGEVVRSGRARSAAQWGDLPPRLREALTQGLDNPYSRLYKRLTEAYYTRLAEEGGDE